MAIAGSVLPAHQLTIDHRGILGALAEFHPIVPFFDIEVRASIIFELRQAQLFCFLLQLRRLMELMQCLVVVCRNLDHEDSGDT